MFEKHGRVERYLHFLLAHPQFNSELYYFGSISVAKPSAGWARVTLDFDQGENHFTFAEMFFQLYWEFMYYFLQDPRVKIRADVYSGKDNPVIIYVDCRGIEQGKGMILGGCRILNHVQQVLAAQVWVSDMEFNGEPCEFWAYEGY